MKTINWGLLSTAQINSALINPIKASPSSQLKAVASRSIERATAYAKEWKIPQVYGNYDALLDDPDIDVIYNPLPNAMHYEWTIKAIQKGKHVLCEKPLVANLENLEAIKAAAEHHKVTVFEAFMYLHHPQTSTVQDLLRQKEIGKIQVINSWFSFYLPPENRTNIRLNSDLGGGAFWDVGVYPNSMSIVLAGSEAPEMVSANLIRGETGVDINMVGQLFFKNDVVGQIVCGFRMPFRQGTTIVGDGGSITIPEPWKPGMNGKDSHILVKLRDAEEKKIVIPAVDPYLCEVQAMEACILEGKEPVVPLSLSREFLRSTLALYTSAQLRQSINLR